MKPQPPNFGRIKILVFRSVVEDRDGRVLHAVRN
jgi:hypothetical protein